MRPSSTIRNAKRVLILEPDSKSLKRIMDCLFSCGFQLERLHPVRIISSLDWALRKYTPHVLIVDYRLSGNPDGIQLLQELRPVLPVLERVILMTPPISKLSEREDERIDAFCNTWRIRRIAKPINRFSLGLALESIHSAAFARDPSRRSTEKMILSTRSGI